MSSEVRKFFFDVWCCITELLSMLLTLSYINGLMISYIYITGLLAGGSQVQRIASPGTSSC